MQIRAKIDKIPHYCTGPERLQAGDILIFDHAPKIPGRAKNHSAYFTVQQQGLLNETGGHSQAVHAGFIVNTDDGLKLAHLVGDGFMLDDLDTESENYSKFLNRTTHIYRPRKHREAIAAELAEIVKGLELGRGAKLLDQAREHRTAKNAAARVKWQATVGIRSFVTRLLGSLKIINHHPENIYVEGDKPLPENVISKESICSRFVADAYISACNRLTNRNPEKFNFRLFFMNLSQHTVPKTLQAYLYRNTTFDYFVMPHSRLNKGVYEKLKELVMWEINRMNPVPHTNDLNHLLTAVERKGLDLMACLRQFDERAHSKEDLMRRSIALIKELLPILKRNTGLGLVTPGSYRRIMKFAKNEGIFSDNFKYDLHDRSEDKIRKLAQQQYSFNKPLAKLYRNYRRIGYSDEEAKFECKPSYGDWFKISPVRNALITCTFIGFFAWVLPHGLARASQARKRNLQFENCANRISVR